MPVCEQCLHNKTHRTICIVCYWNGKAQIWALLHSVVRNHHSEQTKPKNARIILQGSLACLQPISTSEACPETVITDTLQRFPCRAAFFTTVTVEKCPSVLQWEDKDDVSTVFSSFNQVKMGSQAVIQWRCKTIYVLNSIFAKKVVCEYMYLHINVKNIYESGMVAHMNSNPSTWE